MVIEASNIPISLDAMLPGREADFKAEVARMLGIVPGRLKDVRLLRRSVDARRKQNVHFVVSVKADVGANGGRDACPGDIHPRRGVSVKPYEAPAPLAVPDLSGAAADPGFLRPVVVGTGPAGLFCALYLARAGLQPLVVERGQAVEERMASVRRFAEGGPLDTESNVQFGEGGAGTFSDGKLTTGTKSPHIRHVLEEFVDAGAPADILVDARPHIGTDLLPGIVANLRRRIIEAGGEVRFSTKLAGISVSEGSVAGVTLESVADGSTEDVPAHCVVLATGHSARDTFTLLHGMGIEMRRKPFAVGVRIEHLQEDMDRAQYGDTATHPALGAADYKLAVHNEDGRGVYTFCMCPGGTVVAAASEEGGVCVNGMSANARDGANSNSALLASVLPGDLPGDDVLAGMDLQREMEHLAYNAAFKATGEEYSAPVQTLGSFMDETPSVPSSKVSPTYPRKVAWTDVSQCLPGFVADSIKEAVPALDRKLHGFADPEAVLTGVEARSSSPVQVTRDAGTLESVSLRGLYPAGEGAGYAGGIMSAACDGIRVAEAVCDTCEKSLFAQKGKF